VFRVVVRGPAAWFARLVRQWSFGSSALAYLMRWKGRHLVVIVGIAVLLASVGSHGLARCLRIYTSAGTGHKWYGVKTGPANALIAGSSLAYDGIDWQTVAERWCIGIESWPVPGSSPAEWERLQSRSPHIKITFVAVSVYDLNEAWLCDFRADLVPLSRTVADLAHGNVDGTFAKRLLSCYPRMWVRKLFPTVGRSQAVLAALRDTLQNVIQRGSQTPTNENAALRLASDAPPDVSIKDWPHDRLLRRLAAMRDLSQGRHFYAGPKRLALFRLMRRAAVQGPVVVVVLPVSPPYMAELVTPKDRAGFENLLAEVRAEFPGAQWVRLDRVRGPDSAEFF